MGTALYGPDGFYRRPAGPAAHFRTSVSASPLFAAALLRLATEVYDELGQPGSFALVDLGSSNGSFLRIRNEIELIPGDHFRVGQQLFRVDFESDALIGRAPG